MTRKLNIFILALIVNIKNPIQWWWAGYLTYLPWLKHNTIAGHTVFLEDNNDFKYLKMSKTTKN